MAVTWMAYVLATCGIVVACVGMFGFLVFLLLGATLPFGVWAVPLWMFSLVVALVGIVLTGMPFLFEWKPGPQ